ncbi:hypothetical protein [Sphingomonas flavalba]|uniref:hypothetical protein n=1 Tax=Sphingomonas flavalba TaxID=2559804 RepID=UPI00109DF299|nr:hypothetical protein [Sphingomonas flavalba]
MAVVLSREQSANLESSRAGVVKDGCVDEISDDLPCLRQDISLELPLGNILKGSFAENDSTARSDDPVSLASGALIGIADILNGELACQLRALISALEAPLPIA